LLLEQSVYHPEDLQVLRKVACLTLAMRGIIVLLLVSGLLLLGCTQPGESGPAAPNATNQTNATEPVQACSGPVCGGDNVTYKTDCEAELAGVSIMHSGACTEANCTDSDGGLNPTVAGTTQKGAESYGDYCLDENQLIEYACIDNAIDMATIQCGQNRTCDAGRCVDATKPPEQNATPPVPQECSGMLAPDIFRKDTATFNGTSYEDSCVEYRVVKDYYCEGGVIQSINNQCPSGHACADGACYRLSFNCTETDAGNDTTLRGKTTVFKGLTITLDEYDDCIDQAVVKEYSCLDNGTAAISEIQCQSGLKCSGGRCVKGNCNESDGGLDIYKYGVTKAEGKEYRDYCINDHDVIEYYCYGDSVESTDRDCGKGYICNADSGRCVEGSIS
jgi:hypothetical protein